jgi:hypothetical protein
VHSAGFPILTHFLIKPQTTQGGFNLGGINATGQIADIPGNFGLIDRDTPEDVYTKQSYMDPNDEWTLVFSDEFNTDGRTFYPGDDPYWEAVDLHYWGTVCPFGRAVILRWLISLLYRQNDLEWYDPGQGEPFSNQTCLFDSNFPTSNHPGRRLEDQDRASC